MPRAGWFLILAPCYLATFLGRPPVLLQADHILNADPFRYLEEAADSTVQPRHSGMPVATFTRRLGAPDDIAGSATLLVSLGLASAAHAHGPQASGRRIFPVVLGVGLAAAALWQAVVNLAYMAEIATPRRFGI